MASVHRHPKSDYWQCNFKAWDTKRGWVRVAKSTGIPLSRSKRQAQAIADKYEQAAIALGPESPDRHDREFFAKVLSELCLLAGIKNARAPIDWREWRRRWESEQKHVSEISRKSYGLSLDLFESYARLEDKALQGITKAKLRGFIRHLEKQGLAPRTVQARWSTVKRVLKRAHAEGYLEKDITEGI